MWVSERHRNKLVERYGFHRGSSKSEFSKRGYEVTSECNTLRMIDGSVIKKVIGDISTSIHKGLT